MESEGRETWPQLLVAGKWKARTKVPAPNGSGCPIRPLKGVGGGRSTLMTEGRVCRKIYLAASVARFPPRPLGGGGPCRRLAVPYAPAACR